MPNETPVRKASKPAGRDPRFEPVAKAFARTAGFCLMQDKTGAMRGLMLHGKSFGMSTHGRFVLKLDEERVGALIAEGVGKPFVPAAGRVMKGWVEITHPQANWVKLAKEAHRIAAARPVPAKRKKKKA